ncbi:hypothetical protein SAMN05216266_113164 [Amycolatopsis marina]|uniref:Uncharacterized protein n=1 Tax=Amycolatopsis marina TaxID=490629 RepID=A0A1I1BDW8_9PSEU|nr:hypothetical protein [Amycolatopsis marina]SFB48575.1 hypothetical protein SAMN05216266_113164 [Amycolatopsis marina]
MDVPQNSDLDAAAADLAAQAERATHGLYHRTCGEECVDGPAEVYHVLGSLKLLVNSLSRSLPEMSRWLEQKMWSGELGDEDSEVSFERLASSVFDATTALARAHLVSAQLGQELEMAETASRQLASP